MATGRQLLERIKSVRTKECLLLGEPVKVRVLSPNEATPYIMRIGEVANALREQGKTEESVGAETLKIVAETIATFIVEPSLSEEERQELQQELASIPLGYTEDIMAVFHTIMTGRSEGAPAATATPDAIFRQPGVSSDSSENA